MHAVHAAYTYAEQVELLKKLNRGLSVRRLSEEYAVGVSTIYDLSKQKDKLLEFCIESDERRLLKSRKTLHRAVKLPPFWPAVPQLWFAQAEAQFSLRAITSQQTKFNYVISSLSWEYAAEVRDLILSPPATQPYDTQRTMRTAASEQRRLQQLLSAEDLGDRKPTQLLRHMQQLLGSKIRSVDDALFRELFLQRLPCSVRMILASSTETMNVQTLAEIADRILEATPTTVLTVNTVADDDFRHLRQEVDKLKKRIVRIQSTKTQRKANRDHDNTDSQGVCWYHQCYGSKAKNCKAPCSYAGNSLTRH
ncbi:hypothetical protein M513_07846 [Trichuris suis]|uniref:DUF7041 domain-containing protein n=1 Tax=Trichuris suis TaxID=68888 RepID=A0A085M200_9BILA|nr:hypothetical protein M513_07846 [Trichuris suis]